MLSHVPLRLLPLVPAPAQSLGVRSERLRRTGAGGVADPPGGRAGGHWAGGGTAGGEDRLVHAAALRPSHPVAAGAAAEIPRTHAGRRGRLRLSPPGRHTAPFSTGQPDAPHASFLRDRLRVAGAGLRLHLFRRTRAVAGARVDDL